MQLKRYKKLVNKIEIAETQKKHKKARKLKKLLINKFKPTFGVDYYYYYYDSYHTEWEIIDNDEIIYIPEFGYVEDFPKDVYTKNDLIKICFNSESLARELWEELQGLLPETLLDDWMECYDYEEELIESMNKFGADLELVKAGGYID